MTTWHGRRGSVILGPTEDRVARYLEHATKHGRVTIRTVELAGRLQLERSEAYRITRRLRTLGLFGIENDRGGTKGGRRYWRTAIESGPGLDADRHRTAWARVVAYLRARRSAAHRGLARLRQRQHVIESAHSHGLPTAGVGSGDPLPLTPAGNFRERLRAAAVAQGLQSVVALVDEWSAA